MEIYKEITNSLKDLLINIQNSLSNINNHIKNINEENKKIIYRLIIFLIILILGKNINDIQIFSFINNTNIINKKLWNLFQIHNINFKAINNIQQLNLNNKEEDN